MLDRIIRFSIQNKFIIGLFTLVLIIWGGYSLSQLLVDVLPHITNNQVQIIHKSSALIAPNEERLISYPIEHFIKSLPVGVDIHAYLDRTYLVNQAPLGRSEGALIIFFVLVFLLENWRAGLVVASMLEAVLADVAIAMLAILNAVRVPHLKCSEKG